MMTETTTPKPRAVDIRSWSDFKEWWNKKLALRVKGIAYTLFVTSLIVLGGQFQISSVNAANIDAICETRAAGREDLRQALYAIVDLSTLFPDSEGAEAYTESRIVIIDTLIDPDKDKEGCSA